MTAIQRSRTLDSRLKNRKGKTTLYPKGSDGLCSITGCREIARFVGPVLSLKQVCENHLNDDFSMIQAATDDRRKVWLTNGKYLALPLPHIVRKEEDGRLYVRCVFCLLEWRPLSFDLPKEDRDYGRIPNKCSVKNCRATILTLVGKQPRFLRGSRPKGFIKDGGKS